MPTYLTKEAILAVDDTQYEEVECPEWGGTVLVRSLMGVERDAFEQESVQYKGKDKEINMRNIRARLLARSIVTDRLDEGGKVMFTLKEVEQLGRKNARTMDRVFEVAMKLSGLSDEDVKELVTNFTEDPSEDFGSN